MNVLRIPFVALVAVVVLTTAAAALAQQPPMSNRPFRGVFGGGMSDTEQSLTVTGSFGTGYDSDVYAAVRGESGVVGGLRPRVGASVAFWSGSASYSLSREKVSLGASAATTTLRLPRRRHAGDSAATMGRPARVIVFRAGPASTPQSM